MDIKLNGENLDRKNQIKYLGVIIEENLKWDAQLDYLFTIISRNIGVMSRAKYSLSCRELKCLYNSLVLPYFNYCAAVWGNNYVTKLDKLFKLQKRAVRIIAQKPFLHPTNCLFIELRLLKLHDLIKEQNIVILSQALKQEIPSVISSLFELHAPRNTRLVQHFNVPFAATIYRKFALSIQGPRTWNQIICPLFNNLNDVPLEKSTLKNTIRNFFWNLYLSEEVNE